MTADPDSSLLLACSVPHNACAAKTGSRAAMEECHDHEPDVNGEGLHEQPPMQSVKIAIERYVQHCFQAQ